MAREIRLDSSLTVDQVFAAMEARNRDWRPTDIPEALRPYDAMGFRVIRKGNSFTLRVDRPQRDNVEWIDCRGTITPTPTGCHIEARMRRTGGTWVILILLSLFSGWQLAKGRPAWAVVGEALFVTMAFLSIRIIVFLIRDNQAEAEHRVFETILRRAAVGDKGPLTAPRAVP